MPTPLPYKPANFAKLFAPKVAPPVIQPTTGPAPDTPVPVNSTDANGLLYLALGIIALVVVWGGFLLIDKNTQLNYQLIQASSDVNKLTEQMKQMQSTNNLFTDSKTNNHDKPV